MAKQEVKKVKKEKPVAAVTSVASVARVATADKVKAVILKPFICKNTSVYYRRREVVMFCADRFEELKEKGFVRKASDSDTLTNRKVKDCGC